MSGGEVGALLSIVTSETPFQDAIAALQAVSEGGLSSAALTLKRLLKVLQNSCFAQNYLLIDPIMQTIAVRI